MPKPHSITPLSMSDKIFMLLYGHPNAGKTSAIAEAARQGQKILLIRTALDHIPARAIGSNMEQWVVNHWEEMDEALQYARLEGDEWDWIWLDSISLGQDQLLQSIWDATIADKPERARYRVDKLEYGVNMWRLEQWVRHMVGAQITNVGITAHPFMGENPFNEEGGLMYMPWIQGKGMITKICGMMSFVGYMEVREGDDDQRWRRLHTQMGEAFYAKDQYDAYPKGYVDHPTLPKLETAILEAKKRAVEAAGTSTRGATRGAPRGSGNGRGRGATGATAGRRGAKA